MPSSQPTLWTPPQSIAEREQALLAPYAVHSTDTKGRRHAEPPHTYRGPFQRDRDRIVHSTAYRRLSYKTQVFTGEMGDYHRTRLTHTLEVSSLARTLARALRLNEDLVEALALAHDIGHPPFGHSGEDKLDELLADHGGFNHNHHALRIVELLEQRYCGFAGLNLSSEVLEGQRTRIDKDLARERPSLEVQTVEAADSIAYDAHDADDALELGLLTLGELVEVPLWREAADRVTSRHGPLNDDDLRRAAVHELLDFQVGDLLREATGRLVEFEVHCAEDVLGVPPIIIASGNLAEKKTELETFLHQRVYRHPRVMAMRRQAQDALGEMFDAYLRSPELLPGSYQQRIDAIGIHRSSGDYLAGMTDRFAIARHGQMFAKQQSL